MSLFWGEKKSLEGLRHAITAAVLILHCQLIFIHFWVALWKLVGEVKSYRGTLACFTSANKSHRYITVILSFWSGRSQNNLSGPLGTFCSFLPDETVFGPCKEQAIPHCAIYPSKEKDFSRNSRQDFSVGAFLPLYLSGNPTKRTGMEPGHFTAIWALTWSPSQGKDFCPAKASKQAASSEQTKWGGAVTLRAPQNCWLGAVYKLWTGQDC